MSADIESDDKDEAYEEDDADEDDKELNEEFILNFSQPPIDLFTAEMWSAYWCYLGSQVRAQVELTVRCQLGKDIQYSVRKLRKCEQLYTCVIIYGTFEEMQIVNHIGK